MSFKHICYDNTHSYNNLGIRRVIICSTVSLCIPKMKRFLHESHNNVQYLLKCSAFGSVFNKLTNMGF